MLPYLYSLAGDASAMAKNGLTRPVGQKIRGGYRLNLAGRVPSTSSAGGWSAKNGFIAQFGPRNETNPLVRLDINPECLNPHGFSHLRKLVTEIFCIQRHWVQSARVSRVDAALDLHGCSPGDWAWDLPKRRNRQLFLDDGEILTLYLGSKYGNPMVVYDKADRLGLHPSVERTRIEFRDTRSNILQDLPNMACPFEYLLVFNPRTIKSAIQPLRRALMPVAHGGGMRGVLDLYPEAVHPEIREQLQASTPAWWKPLEVWEQWPTVLESTLPGLFDVSAEGLALVESYSKLKVPASNGPAPSHDAP
jgi:hypothetical protein